MATTDDQAQAKRLLKIHKRNLERLEIQRAQFAGMVNLAIDNQIDEEKANIAALEPIANPPAPTPSPKVQEFVVQASDGNWAMMFSQFVLLNARMTAKEEQDKEQAEQIEKIIEDQSRAAIDRMQTKEAISDLSVQVSASEQARRLGARWYRRAITTALSVSILALIVGCAALAAVMR
jgi:hypothetical protein